MISQNSLLMATTVFGVRVMFVEGWPPSPIWTSSHICPPLLPPCRHPLLPFKSSSAFFLFCMVCSLHFPLVSFSITWPFCTPFSQEWGGYFIVNGKEKILRMLILPRRNYVRRPLTRTPSYLSFVSVSISLLFLNTLTRLSKSLNDSLLLITMSVRLSACLAVHIYKFTGHMPAVPLSSASGDHSFQQPQAWRPVQ